MESKKNTLENLLSDNLNRRRDGLKQVRYNTIVSLLGQYNDTIISIALLGVGGDQCRGQATTVGADANRI